MRQDCKEVRGALNAYGYGTLEYKGRSYMAHRLSYCFANGVEHEDIRDLVVRHDCDNPACVNPDHLSIGTVQDNVDDRVRRGRQHDNSGEKNGRSKLTNSQREEIRARYIPRCLVNGQAALAREYGVHQSQISRIVN